RAYTLPYMSLVTERQGERMLRRMFGGACLEDCWLECFSCATNLTRAELVVHRRGPVVPALLSSSAIPGVAPPMVAEHGELLVDGGVLDNLPAGHLHAGLDGAVIASDTSPEVDIQADLSYAVTPPASPASGAPEEGGLGTPPAPAQTPHITPPLGMRPGPELRTATPQGRAWPGPVPVPAVPGVPRAAPRVRIDPPDVAGWRRDGVGR